MTRADQIQSIIDQRKPLAEKILRIVDRLDTLQKWLTDVEAFKHQIAQDLPASMSAGFTQAEDLDPYIQRINQIQTQFQNLSRRFSRKTLNIGVVGRMGQGKSTLLQTLTQLSNNEIPARSGGACTAVCSVIYHRPNQETIAEVTFHSTRSLLDEVILPYFEELHLEPKPTNLESFARSLPKIDPSSGSYQETLYKRLQNDYHRSLPKYQPLLREQQYRRTLKQEIIPSCITQDRDENGNLKDPVHLAISKVEIFCDFGNHEIGNIALVDIPGIGDFRLGDEQTILEALAKEVDVVLFVRRPDSLRYSWETEDTKLYDKATQALNNLSERSFMILNHVEIPDSTHQDNLEACRRLKEDIAEGRVKIRVVDTIIANCANSESANQKVLDTVLEHLSHRIAKIDQTHFQQTCQHLLKPMCDTLRDTFERMIQTSSDFDDQFAILFEGNDGRGGLWRDMTSKLGKLLHQLRIDVSEEDATFKQRAEAVLANCQAEQFPNPEQISAESFTKSSQGLRQIHDEYLNEFRSRLSNSFLELDASLQDSLERAKKEVQKALVAEDGGKLGKLSSHQGSDFFKDLASQMPPSSNIQQGFRNIGEFNVSFAGIVLDMIRSHFTPLFPDTSEAFSFNTSEDVHEALKNAYSGVLEKCTEEIKSLYTKPSQIAYTMVDEFADRAFYSSGAKQSWRKFTDANKGKIWDELKRSEEIKAMRRNFNELIEEAKSANQALYDEISYL